VIISCVIIVRLEQAWNEQRPHAKRTALETDQSTRSVVVMDHGLALGAVVTFLLDDGRAVGVAGLFPGSFGTST